MRNIDVLSSIAPLGPSADVWFLDIWGVLHNGVRPYASAVAACQKYRSEGGRVVLVSNSPRPHDGVVRQLDQVGVARDAYDAVITSGDVSRRLIADYAGKRVFHLGPERDLPVYAGTGADPSRAPEDAAAVVCTGLFNDDSETPDDYRVLLSDLRAGGLTMVCVNPDLQVERDGRIIYCAGALAQAYAAAGGKVLYAGKPYAPIYDAAIEIAMDLSAGVSRERILAIGDGVKTDIAGATAAGLRSVFISSPVHVAPGTALQDAVAELFPDEAARPVAVMTALAW
jgi:HAD superfamily hydrolase (TIGR01459 family)